MTTRTVPLTGVLVGSRRIQTQWAEAEADMITLKDDFVEKERDNWVSSNDSARWPVPHLYEDLDYM